MTGLAALFSAGAVLVLLLGLRRFWSGGMVEWQRRKRIRHERVRPAAAPGAAIHRLRRIGTLAGTVVSGLFLFAVLYALSGSTGLGMAGSLGGFMLPGWWTEWQRTRQLVRASDQLDRAMGLIAAALRRGATPEVAFAQAAEGIGDPLGGVLEQVSAATGVGLAFSQALSGARKHPAVAENSDFQVFVTQVAIASERGANIVQAFETLRGIISSRRRYRASVSEQMGQHLIQSVTIILVGLVVLISYAFLTPDGLAPLVGNPLGQALLLVSVLGNVGLLRWNHVSMLRQLRQV